MAGVDQAGVDRHLLDERPAPGDLLGLVAHRSPVADGGAHVCQDASQVLGQGSARLAEGLSILVYPEGTRVPAGETRKFGISGALLASRTGCLVVPVTHDAGYYWPRRGLLKKPGTIRVIIGPPIQAAGREPREINAEAQDIITTTLAEIRRPAG